MLGREVHIVVPGEVVAKGRPRFSKRGNFVRTYTPKKTKDYEAIVRDAASDAMDYESPFEGALFLSVDVYFPIPKSYTKRDKEAAESGRKKPAKKPDIDNLIKTAMDGLNEVVFHDDKQVTHLQACKKYSYEPRMEITVREVV